MFSSAAANALDKAKAQAKALQERIVALEHATKGAKDLSPLNPNCLRKRYPTRDR